LEINKSGSLIFMSHFIDQNGMIDVLLIDDAVNFIAEARISLEPKDLCIAEKLDKLDNYFIPPTTSTE